MEEGSEEKEPTGASEVKREMSIQAVGGFNRSFEVVVLDEMEEVKEKEKP